MEVTDNNLSHVKEPKQEFEYSCDICGKLCNNKTTLLRHRKHHTEEAQHACDKCGKTYHEKHELKIHYRIHTGEKPFSCHVCGKSFRASCGLNRHRKKVHNIMPERKAELKPCNICSQEFTSLTKVTEHKKIHLEKNRNICVFCKQTFSDSNDLFHHELTHRNDALLKGENFEQEKEKLLKESQKVLFHCDICHKEFTCERKFKYHINSHTDEFSCDLCKMSFKSETSLDSHKLKHEGIKPYSCDVCNRAFLRKGDLNNHKKYHSDLKPFSCEICNVAYVRKTDLKQHLATTKHMDAVAGTSTTFSCTSCDKIFTNPGILKMHLKTHARQATLIPCTVCNKNFIHQWKLDIHTRTHTGEKPYSCDICQMSFSQSGNLKRHMFRAHEKKESDADNENLKVKDEKIKRKYKKRNPKNIDLKIEACSSDSENSLQSDVEETEDYNDDSNTAALDLNVKLETAEEDTMHTNTDNPNDSKDYPDNKDDLESNIVICKSETVEITELCKEEGKDNIKEELFDDHYNVDNDDSNRLDEVGIDHVKNEEENEDLVETVVDIKLEKEDKKLDKPFTCDTCNKTFKYASLLKSHKRTHDKKTILCEFCEKLFADIDALNRHKIIHTGEKTHICDVCNKAFLQKHALNAHKITHLAEKPNTCEYCGKAFSAMSKLNIHKRIHTGEKPYKCEACNKCFREGCSFRFHKTTEKHRRREIAFTQGIKLEDVPKKPRAKPKIKKERKLSKDAENTTCDVCNKKFSKRQYMKEHKRIHTGEKPFSCDICQKSFTHYTTFKEHKKSHTEGKTFSCETCGRAFQRKSQLIEHERIHTGEKPYSCELCNTSYASQSNLYHHNKTEGHIKRMNEAKDEDTSDYY